MAISDAEQIIGWGKKVEYSTDSGSTWTVVEKTVDVQMPEAELSVSDRMHDGVTDFTHPKRPGTYEPGTATFSYLYTSSQFTALETLFQKAKSASTRDAATVMWRFSLPADGQNNVATMTFSGFITKHPLPVEGGDDGPIVEVEIQVSGSRAWAAAASAGS